MTATPAVCIGSALIIQVFQPGLVCEKALNFKSCRGGLIIIIIKKANRDTAAIISLFALL